VEAALQAVAAGLTDAEAAERLARDGPNELPSARRRGLLALLFEILREPMIFLLAACALVYLLLGDREEALVLVASVCAVVGLSLWQAGKTERALDALRDLASPRALVVRGGREQRIPGGEVVAGDVVVIAEGDRVPADARLLHASSLSVDESLLTGESAPVRKRAGGEGVAPPRPGGEDLPFVWSGTLAVRGSGVCLVHATGARTEMGRIGRALVTIETQKTSLQRETARWVRVLAIAGVVLCLAVAAAWGLARGNPLEGLLAGLALAIALLPEEFPVILTVFLALGAWRLSHRRVLARRASAIEALGAATVLAVDKTGTLTENRMRVAALAVDGATWRPADGALPEEVHALVEHALLASRQKPFDPMEQAVAALARDSLAGTEHLHEDFALVHEYPLTHELLAMTHVWARPGGGARVVATKGAPEAVADLCHLGPERTAVLAARTGALADDGLRVLGVARAEVPPGPLPAGQHDLDFEWLGLVGLADPLRAGVPEAVAECDRAGVRTVMITGDYAGTARTIATQAGLPAGDVLTGPDLEALGDAALAARVATAHVFARVLPEQKLRLVRAFQAAGGVVAMTGDGVNDAPALRAAQIGIAMGGRGTDVAREAAALVLLDDDYASIVGAVRLGRRIFANIRKAMAYVLAMHVPIAGVSLVPVLLGWPLVLLPVHIVFLELVIDPACSVAFEAEPDEPGLMDRPPRDPKEPLLPRRTVVRALLDGLVALALVLGVVAFVHGGGSGPEAARAAGFTTLVLLNLALIATNRASASGTLTALRVPNPAVRWIAAGAVAALAACLAIAPLRNLLRFAPLSGFELGVAVLAAVAGFGVFEALRAAERMGASRTRRG
jgi:Ca2+-transporting ATPase